MSLHFAVFYGSVRSERHGIKYARFLNTQLAARAHTLLKSGYGAYLLELLQR